MKLFGKALLPLRQQCKGPLHFCLSGLSGVNQIAKRVHLILVFHGSTCAFCLRSNSLEGHRP